MVHLVPNKVLGAVSWQNILPSHTNAWKLSKSVLTYLVQLFATFQTQISAVLHKLYPKSAKNLLFTLATDR